MQITAEVNLDDVVSEVEQALMDSSSFDRHVNDLVESLVTDQIAEAIERLDIDDIGDFECRVEEIAEDTVRQIAEDIARDAVSEAMADAPDPQDSDDRITDLEQTVEALKAQVDALTEGLAAAALLLGHVVKV